MNSSLEPSQQLTDLPKIYSFITRLLLTIPPGRQVTFAKFYIPNNTLCCSASVSEGSPPRYTMGTGRHAGTSAGLKWWVSTGRSTVAQEAPEQWLCNASEKRVAMMTDMGSGEFQVLI